jgi:hypothetical protein
MKRTKSIPPEGRDQDPTTFAEILQHMLWLEPRATAAVLIDSEGETVDYASSLPSYYTKVAAAYLRVVIDDVSGARHLLQGELTHTVIAGRYRSFYVHPLPEGYALILVLRRWSFRVSARAVALTNCRLAREAGWRAPPEETLPWHPVDVEPQPLYRHRPSQMKTGDAWEQVDVLGSVVGLAEREKGYRCRLQSGAEITLVREANGIWFADQPPRGLSSRLGPESQEPPAAGPSSASSPPTSSFRDAR